MSGSLINVQQSIPRKGTTRDQVLDLLFMQLASYLQANVTQICLRRFLMPKLFCKQLTYISMMDIIRSIVHETK